MSEAKENNGARSQHFANTGTASAISVSADELKDLCDRCHRVGKACSIRFENHVNHIPVWSCAHFKHDVAPIMVVGTNGRVI